MSDLWGNTEEQPAFGTVSAPEVGLVQDNSNIWGNDSINSLDSAEAMNDRAIMNNSHTVSATDKDLENIEMQARSAAIGAGDQSVMEDNARMSGASNAVESAADKAALQTAGADYMMNAQANESVKEYEERKELEARQQPQQDQEQSQGWFAGAFAGMAAMGAAGKESLMSAIEGIKSWIMPNREQGTNVSLAELGELSPNGPKAQRGIEGRGL
jgi:hypothetical protein